MILLHANPGDSQDFDAVIPILSEQYTVISIDWPGYGQSDPLGANETVTVLSYYRVLLEFIDALLLPSAIVVGNSIGGNAAVRLAAAHPEKVAALVLVSPGGFTPQNLISRNFCRLQGSRFSIPPYLLASVYLNQRTATVNDMLKRAKTNQASPEALALNRAMWRSFGKPENDLSRIAQTITKPTLLMFGARDPLISATKDGNVAAKSMSEARLLVAPCGHAPFAEIPDYFVTHMHAFLQDNGL